MTAALAKKRKATASAPNLRQIVDALRDYVLPFDDGEFIGGESELVARFGVSRPTFRQAAKVIEQEQLLRIKRGVGGGFFARDPKPDGVAHMAAVYLYSRGATIVQAVEAGRALFTESAGVAARLRNPEVARQFENFLKRQKTPDSLAEFRGFLASEREFFSILGAASGNPVIELFLSAIIDFAVTFMARSVYSGRPDRIEEYQKLQAKMIDAILAGDEEMARLMSTRRSDQILIWIKMDETSHGDEFGHSSDQASRKRITFKRASSASTT